MRANLNQADTNIEHAYSRKQEGSALPPELCYADDSDYPTLTLARKEEILTATYEVLPQRNLKVNQDKTEHTIIKRGGDEEWRKVRKLGSLLGVSEDMARRKQLSIVGMNELQSIWIRKDQIHLSRRLALYRQLVKPLLVYNCGCWAMRKQDTDSINAFHRQQLRRILGIRWPHRIRNKRLYEITEEEPISLFILKQRWQLLGHILRSHIQSPANQAMEFYFEPTSAKGFRGRPQVTLPTTIDNDLQRITNLQRQNATQIFTLRKFDCRTDLMIARSIAQERGDWKEFTNIVLEAAQAEITI